MKILYYLLVLFGTGLGMFLTLIVQSELINRSKKFEAGFNQAFRFYTSHNKGAIYTGIVMVIIFIFILDNLQGTKISWLSWLLSRMRIFSVIVGVISMALGFWFVKGAHKKLDDFAKQFLGAKKDEDESNS